MQHEYVRFIYILLNTITVFTFCWVGYKISKTKGNKNYWIYASLPIISYCISMGLRFGRMIDYNVYCSRYYDLGKDITAGGYEFLFSLTCHLLNLLSAPYSIFILLCSFLIIYATLFYLKDYKEAMPFMLLVFLWETINVENYIRWYFALSVFLFAVYYLKRNKLVQFILFGIVASSIHIGFLPMAAIFYILSKIKNRTPNPYAVQVVFIISLLYGSIQALEFLTPYIQYLGFDERSIRYTKQFGDLITGEFGSVGIREADGMSTQIRKIFAYSFPLYMIPRLLQNKKINNIDAYAYCIGIIVAPIFMQVEILDRYASLFLYFSIIVSGQSYYYASKNYFKLKLFMRVFFILSLISNVWPTISGILSRTEWYTMLYIWDSTSSESLPLHYFFK